MICYDIFYNFPTWKGPMEKSGESVFPGDQTSQFSIRLAKAKMIRQQRLEVFLEVHLQHQGTKGQEADTGTNKYVGSLLSLLS